MKKYLPQITAALIITVLFSVLFWSGTVHAEASDNNVSFYGFTFGNFINTMLATIMNAALGAASVILSMSAALLNVTLIITTHIKEFVDATPAILSIWQTIRDISGLFFIFVLLYAAIQKILGIGNNYGNIIKQIVIAAFLVNFSFFIVSVAIDASNVISLAIFNAMIPSAPTVNINKDTKLPELTATLSGYDNKTGQAKSGVSGISDIFMNSLKIQKFYDPKTGNLQGLTTNSPLKIVFIGVVGVIMTLTAAGSFFLASLAFIARLVILLFLLAFSPIWFAGMVVPGIKEYVSKFKNALYSQLVFMPVYLLLMYAALSILNSSDIIGAANATTDTLPTGTNWLFGYIVLAINFVMVIIMLNLPLVVGLGMGGVAVSWMGKYTSKLSAENIWKGVGKFSKSGAQSAYRGTVGRTASVIAQNDSLLDAASQKGFVGAMNRLTLKGMRGVASNYNKRLDDQVKERTEFAQSLGFDQRQMNVAQGSLRTLQQQLASSRASGASRNTISNLESQISAAKANIQQIENARQNQYSDALENRSLTNSPTTLWASIPRPNRVGAAKIKIPILEKQLSSAKDSLKETRDDIKQLVNAITNSGAPTGTQTSKLAQLQRDEARKIASVNQLQGTIDNLKLIK